MLLMLPAAKCVVIADEQGILKSEKTGKPHANSKSGKNDTPLALILIMPNGKEIRLLIKDCERGQAQLELPDES